MSEMPTTTPTPDDLEALAEGLRAHDWHADDDFEWSRPCRHADHEFHAFCEVCSGNVDRIAEALAPTVARIVAEKVTAAQAEALREAVGDWQQGQWADVLIPNVTANPIDNGQRVTDWLRARAALKFRDQS